MPACPSLFNASFTKPQAVPCSAARGFQLRFRSLFREGRGYSFPCDAMGNVDLDRLSERARVNYFFARAMVGRDLHVAEVVAGEVHESGPGDEGPVSCWPQPAWRRPGREH
jgi:hypothetical protein